MRRARLFFRLAGASPENRSEIATILGDGIGKEMTSARDPLKAWQWALRACCKARVFQGMRNLARKDPFGLGETQMFSGSCIHAGMSRWPCSTRQTSMCSWLASTTVAAALTHQFCYQS